MLRDDIPFEIVWDRMQGESGPTKRAARALIDYLERKFGARFLFDRTQLPFGLETAAEYSPLIEALRSVNVIRSMERRVLPPDEPRLMEWRIQYGDRPTDVAVGATFDDATLAIAKAIAEAVERAVWFESDDYFRKPQISSVTSMEKRGRTILPSRFVGAHGAAIRDDAAFLWIEGVSLTDESAQWIPAQVISGMRGTLFASEPAIRGRITTGLATHPDRNQALLSGAYEIIERDAYMIWWLNQLIVPRYNPDTLARQSETLHTLISTCRRYQLEPHILGLPTDAPVHVIGVMLEDQSGHAPRFGLGTAAHHDLAHAAEKAITEALRARRGARARFEADSQEDDAHYGRLAYWAHPERAALLEQLVAGPCVEPPPAKTAPVDERLHDITAWTTHAGYACAAVPLTHAALNKTPWHIEMVVIPELQPLYYNEQHQVHLSPRVQTIPAAHGYTPLAKPFTEHPHPFA